MRPFDSFIKRLFDIFVSLLLLFLFWWLIIAGFIMAAISTGRNGFFLQKRVGQNGRIFNIIKLRTMREVSGVDTTITAQNDMRITKTGAFLRKYKIDELPQLINVLKGDMSLVGPRPDVRGYADKLKGEDRIILSVKPGITGPASIKYKNEEALLAKQSDPKKYNDEVIYPDKVRINKGYIQNYTFLKDIRYLFQTIKG
jgi:lipopolysaccharide/colanic/teichoic acid biosynthesis glycosyltransferase